MNAVLTALSLSLLAVASSFGGAGGQLALCDDKPITEHGECVSVGTTVCASLYNGTYFPNNITTNVGQAASELRLYRTLYGTGPQDFQCSPLSLALVCLAFFPRCEPETGSRGLGLPCRSLCEAVVADCRDDLAGIAGADTACILNCQRYPTTDCIAHDDPLVLPLLLSPSPTPTPTPQGNTSNNTGVDNELGCPPPSYTFFRDSQRRFATGWIATWATLCFLSTLLTILTFLLNPSRFHYPWRPVVYLALSFNIHSLGYFLSLVLGRALVTCPQDQFVRTSVPWRWTHTPCILVFGILYYSTLTAFLWWLVLTFCWLLSAAFKWSNESISHLSPFFHVISWVLPLLTTISLIAVRVVSADELTATCFLVRDSTQQTFLALLLGLILPLVLFLIIGFVFLMVGFVSVIRIRSFMRHGGRDKETIILEKLMIRIGVFVAVYIVPATIMIACYVYELASRDKWASLDDTCTDCTRPNTAVFMIRVFMFLLIGVLTGVWIWSRKTIDSWQTLPSRLRKCYLQGRCDCTEENLVENREQPANNQYIDPVESSI